MQISTNKPLHQITAVSWIYCLFLCILYNSCLLFISNQIAVRNQSYISFGISCFISFCFGHFPFGVLPFLVCWVCVNCLSCFYDDGRGIMELPRLLDILTVKCFTTVYSLRIEVFTASATKKKMIWYSSYCLQCSLWNIRCYRNLLFLLFIY